jgi:hypothetical protein
VVCTYSLDGGKHIKTKEKSSIFCSPTRLHSSVKINAQSAFLAAAKHVYFRKTPDLACPRAYGNTGSRGLFQG